MNCASRLEVVLRQATTHGDRVAVIDVWAEVFKIQEDDHFIRGVIVMESLYWLSALVDEVDTLMAGTDFGEDLYKGHLSKVRLGIAGTNLKDQWLGHKQQLTSEVLHVLSFCSASLPEDETYLDKADLDELQALVELAEGVLTDVEIPHALRVFMTKHVKAMRRSLNQYEVQGARAMHDVVKKAYVDLVDVMPLAAAAHQTSFKQFDALLARFSAVTASAFKRAHGLAARYVPLYTGIKGLLTLHEPSLRLEGPAPQREGPSDDTAPPPPDVKAKDGDAIAP